MMIETKYIYFLQREKTLNFKDNADDYKEFVKIFDFAFK